MNGRRTLAAIAVALIALAANAQQDPDMERGARPGLSYALTDFDHVNLFNGTMTLNLSIGQAYPVNGTLSYSFMASYATNAWKTDYLEEELPNGEFKTFPYMYPSNDDNAGFGWVVTLGRLIFDTPNNVIIYLAPDGGQHTFGDRLHGNDPNEPADGFAVSYTADGTYLRMKQISGGYEVDFPNGHRQFFDSTGMLTSIEDAFGNWVHVSYSTRPPNDSYPGSPVWTITDSVGREHKVYFRPNWAYDTIETGGPSSAVSRSMVDRIVLASFDDPTDPSDGTATYTFHYTAAPQSFSQITSDHKTSRRCRTKTDPFLAGYVVTSLLDSIQGPESVLYSMTYERGDRQNCSYTHDGGASGNLLRMVLPTGSGMTGGRIEWSYQTYVFPGTGPPEGAPSSNAGVKTRTAYDGNTILTETAYEIGRINRAGSTLDYDVWRRLVNRDGNGGVINATRHHFTACRHSTFGCVNPGEYGLPFTRNTPHASDSTVFLSSEVERANTDGSYTALRKTWVRYEGDGNIALSGSVNQRPAYQRTDYEDGKFTDVTYSEFDGLGHYRRAVTGGNFEQGNSRTTFTNYNPNAGTYTVGSNGTLLTTFHLPSSSSAWVLGTFNQQSTTEGASSAGASFCFDALGFMTSQRTFRNWGSAPAQDDLLAIFTRDASGNLVKEQYFGGETNVAPTNQACNSAQTGEAYRIDHAWQHGTRNKSYYVQASGAPMSFDLLDADIDRNTGLVATSRRYSTVGVSDGAATASVYDGLGRPKKVTGPRLRTEYGYAIQPPSITVTDYDRNTNTQMRTSTAEFDALGRMIRETRSMPGGGTSARVTGYNALGWKTQASDWGTSALTKYTYDLFGRPTAIRTPDQDDATALQLAYTGIAGTTRTAKVRTSGDAAPLTAANFSDAVTTEDYDRQGRLIRVTEPAQAVNGTRPVTEYAYDVGGRLTTVCSNRISGACGQSRTFTYDNRGFLLSETHPENGTTTYPAYDARGHVRLRFLGTAAAKFHHLGFVYDRAERLTQVHEAANDGTETRKLKSFVYGTDNSGADLRNGRQTSAMRFNWVTVAGANFNVRVVEAFKYEDAEGNVTSRNTRDYVCQVTGGETCQSVSAGLLNREFEQAFTYDSLGAPSTLDYPRCLHSNCANLIGNRTITNTWNNGFLSSVTWTGAVVPNTFTYHPSGLLNEVRHDNGVVDEQTIDPDVPSRPLSLVTKNAIDPGTCVDPSFTLQPESRTITSGSVPLHAQASGETSPGHSVSYQWYRGTASDPANPVGTNSELLTVSPSTTTSYWVRATNNCSAGGTASVTATITICAAPVVSLPVDRTITISKSTTIIASATGSAVLAYQWYTVAGTIVSQINGAMSPTLTVSPTQTTRYRLTVTNDCGSSSADIAVNVVAAPTVPASVNATYNAGTGENVVTWTASWSSVGIQNYVVERMPDGATFTPSGTSLTDNTGLLAGRAYIYRVRAVDTQHVFSAQSVPAVTTRMVFTDDPVVAKGTLIRGIHVAQLRQAIDAVRFATGLPAAWSNYNPPAGLITALTFAELRNRLNEARASLQLPDVSLTAVIAVGQPIRASTVNELRESVK